MLLLLEVEYAPRSARTCLLPEGILYGTAVFLDPTGVIFLRQDTRQRRESIIFQVAPMYSGTYTRVCYALQARIQGRRLSLLFFIRRWTAAAESLKHLLIHLCIIVILRPLCSVSA